MHFTTSITEIEALLREDAPYLDLTSSLLDLSPIDAEIHFSPREPLTVCGSEEAEKVFSVLGVETELLLKSGQKAAAGETVLKARGSAELLHTGWKVSQNILEHFSAIATRTRAMVDNASSGGRSVEVCGTRKHLPGIKHLSLKALVAGGGYPHRLGLSDSVLIFSNHYELLGGVEALCDRLASIKSKCPEKKVAVEVESMENARLAARSGADIIQLDKLDPASVSAIAAEVRTIDSRIVVAAAGGVNASNAAAYASAGADVLVSSWMYFGKPADYRVVIRKTRG